MDPIVLPFPDLGVLGIHYALGIMEDWNTVARILKPDLRAARPSVCFRWGMRQMRDAMCVVHLHSLEKILHPQSPSLRRVNFPTYVRGGKWIRIEEQGTTQAIGI